MSDRKMTGFHGQVFDRVEMTHQTPDHCDMGRNIGDYIPPIYKRVAPPVRHLNTLNGLAEKACHFCVTNPSRDILSLRWVKKREKKCRPPRQQFHHPFSRHQRRTPR